MEYLIYYILDTLHFEQARKKADILIVSITSDKKVLKGPGRPYF